MFQQVIVLASREQVPAFEFAMGTVFVREWRYPSFPKTKRLSKRGVATIT
jgi:hypothetical protein